LLPAPEVLYQETFQHPQNYSIMFPLQCQNMAQHVISCQNKKNMNHQQQQRQRHDEYQHQTKTTTSSLLSSKLHHIDDAAETTSNNNNKNDSNNNNHILVLTCHRKWCTNSILGGHCDACTGIGDRFHHLMHIVQYIYYDLVAMIPPTITLTTTSSSSSSSSSCPLFPIQLDYPVSGLAILRSFIYQDPLSWWGELFHTRSYHTIAREQRQQPIDFSSLLIEEKMQHQQQQRHTPNFVYAHFTSPLPKPNEMKQMIQTYLSQLPTVTTGRQNASKILSPVLHPLPSYSDWFQWDPCLFHTIFQPDHALQRELLYHHQRILWGYHDPTTETDSTYHNPYPSHIHLRSGEFPSLSTIRSSIEHQMNATIISVGVHFRVGDGMSFPGVIPDDIRIHGSMEENWYKMFHCAEDLGQALIDAHQSSMNRTNVKADSSTIVSNSNHKDMSNNNSNNNNRYIVRYYLATDNADLKELIRNYQRNYQRSLENVTYQIDYHSIYVTDLQPTDHLHGIQSDRNAWLEIFLLSQQNGITVNVRTKHNYSSTAGELSSFSRLAQHIGLHNPRTQIKHCSLD
jgi:hypothetical protein